MAERIKTIECKLDKYVDGLENHHITQIEYNELTSALSYELRLLAQNI